MHECAWILHGVWEIGPVAGERGFGHLFIAASLPHRIPTTRPSEIGNDCIVPLRPSHADYRACTVFRIRALQRILFPPKRAGSRLQQGGKGALLKNTAMAYARLAGARAGLPGAALCKRGRCSDRVASWLVAISRILREGAMDAVRDRVVPFPW